MWLSRVLLVVMLFLPFLLAATSPGSLDGLKGEVAKLCHKHCIELLKDENMCKGFCGFAGQLKGATC
jgi:hypothetical protein